MVRENFSDGRFKSFDFAVDSSRTGKLYYTLTSCAEVYQETLKMIRFGVALSSSGRIDGVIYGFVFKLKRGCHPPSKEVFYDWCDSYTSESAEIARWILDAGCFPQVFEAGDALIIDAFDFERTVPEFSRVASFRAMAKAISRSFRRLAQAYFVIDGFGFQPGSLKHRAAFERAFSTVKSTQLGTVLHPQFPTKDIFLNRGRSLDAKEELLELIARTGPR